MHITRTSIQSPKVPLAQPAVKSQETTASSDISSPALPSEKVEIAFDKEAAEMEQSKLGKKAKLAALVGTALGAAGGIAAGLAGGEAGAVVGLAAAPVLGIAAAAAGGVGGFMLVANRKDANVLHFIGGLVAGAVGAAAGATLDFYGGAALGAMAGSGGGLAGAVAGLVGGSSIGGAVGGLGAAGIELTANSDQYPNLLAKLKKEEAEDKAKKKLERAEQEKFKQEIKEKLKDAFKRA